MHRRIILLHPPISSRSEQPSISIEHRRTNRNATLAPTRACLLQRDLQHRAILRHINFGHPYPFFGAGGTFFPAFRASDNPIAIACFRLVTFLPLRPLFKVPSFISCISVSTFLLADGLYFRAELFFDAVFFVAFFTAFFVGAFFVADFFVAVFLLDAFFAVAFFVVMFFASPF
jgi:hypothetical protein